MREGQRGLCFVRGRVEDGEVVLLTYGRSSGYCVDPIEKKPLNHFLPGTSVLSFGTAGLQPGVPLLPELGHLQVQGDGHAGRRRLARGDRRGRRRAGLPQRRLHLQRPDDLPRVRQSTWPTPATRSGCKAIAVTAGYICPEPRRDFYAHLDAANVDLKGFTEEFYKHVCVGHLEPVLETLEYLRHETDVWFEITTLLIPGRNDGDARARRADVVGGRAPRARRARCTSPPSTPTSRCWTSTARRRPRCSRAREWGLRNGLHYVYTGNVHDTRRVEHLVPGCGALLIERDWYELGALAARRRRALPRAAAWQVAGRVRRTARGAGAAAGWRYDSCGCEGGDSDGSGGDGLGAGSRRSPGCSTRATPGGCGATVDRPVRTPRRPPDLATAQGRDRPARRLPLLGADRRRRLPGRGRLARHGRSGSCWSGPAHRVRGRPGVGVSTAARRGAPRSGDVAVDVERLPGRWWTRGCAVEADDAHAARAQPRGPPAVHPGGAGRR